jgi:hypothetical protein
VLVHAKDVEGIKMPIYHMHTKPVSRGSGHSATAKIAYNTRERINDLRTGEIHKYNSAKMRADLVHSEITFGKDKIDNKHRSEIWNNAELAENRSNSRTAREYVVALPKELSYEQNIELVREFSKELTLKYGHVADWAIHNEREGNGNIHAHILTTTRKFDLETFKLSNKTDLELDNGSLKKQNKPISQDQIKEIRQDWENIQNLHLELAGIAKYVSCEKQENRDLVKVHLGKEATALERKGIKTELGEHNRTIDAPVYLQAQIFAEEQRLLTEKSELSKLQAKQNEEYNQSNDLIFYQNANKRTPSENSISSSNINEQFSLIREYGFEFNLNIDSPDHSYYINVDKLIKVYDKHMDFLQSSNDDIRLGVDVAFLKFGDVFEINGNESFVRSVIETLAKDEKYNNVKLANHEYNQELEIERFIQRAEILDPDKILQEEMDKMAQKLINNAPLIDYEKILKQEELRQQKLEQENNRALSRSRGFSR